MGRLLTGPCWRSRRQKAAWQSPASNRQAIRSLQKTELKYRSCPTPAATLKRGSVVVTNDHGPKLSDAGISKDLSSRAQKLAAVPEAEFEAEVGQWRDRVSEEGRRVSARLQAAGEREQKKRRIEQAPEYAPTNADELAELQHTVSELAAENERLSDRLAVEAMDASEEEKTAAAQTIAELREQVSIMEAELSAVKASRDTYMRENKELKQQVNYWRKQAEKAAA